MLMRPVDLLQSRKDRLLGNDSRLERIRGSSRAQLCEPMYMTRGLILALCPAHSREEIVNACGVDDFHDGVNYTRTSCVIAVSKAKDMFEPFLHQVRWVTATRPC